MSGVILKDGLTPSFNMTEGMSSTLILMQKINAEASKFTKLSMFSNTIKDLTSVSSLLRKIDMQVKGVNKTSVSGNLINNVPPIDLTPKDDIESTSESSSSIIEGLSNKSVINFAKNSAKMFMNTFAKAVQSASELAEVQHMLDSVYQASADEVTAWAKDSLDAYGINTTSAMKYVATMGAMMNSMNINSSSAAEMSENLVGLAGDMASFYNVKVEDVFSKISSAISSEGNSLKDFNVDMSNAKLQAYALSQGMNKTYQSMTAAEQTTLKYNYLMAETANVQGDYIRTSGSFASQQQRMNDKWTELTATLASYFLPVIATVFGIVGGAFDFLTKHSEQVIAALIAIGIALGAILIPKFYEAAVAAHLASITAASAWLTSLWPILLIVAAVIAAITIFNEFGGSVSDIIGFVGGALGFLYAMVVNVLTLIYNALGVFAVFIRNLFIDPIAAIKMLFLDLFQFFASIFEMIAKGLEDLFNWIPGVDVDYSSGFTQYINDLKNEKDLLAAETGVHKFEMKETMDIGQTMGEWNSNWSNFKMPDSPLSDSFTPDGGNIDTVGSIGEIKGDVKITDEDIKLLKDIATNKFVNRYTTLSPNMRVEFSGPINRDVDVDDIISKIETKLEEVSSSSVIEEVVYA